MASRTAGVTVLYSDNDMDDVQQTVSIVREKIKNVEFKEFHNYGHFCFGDMKTDKFPELLEVIVG